MSDPFVHLHVASGYSLRYGVSHPHVLVERAAEHGMDALALTDRDGLYGAVKFAKACMSAGLRPIFGVDLAVAGGSGEGPRRRTPARGGAFVDLRHPRVTLIAQHAGGWAALCRLVSATHLAGERGRPVCSSDLIAEHAAAGGVFVLLGPDSDVGRALAVRRPDLARGHLDRWRAVVAQTDLVVELFSHRGRADVPTADVLDAARRLVVLDPRHVDRGNAEGYLKSGKEMAEVAGELATLAGIGESGRRTLLARARAVADRCAVDPRVDLGIGTVHFPELDDTGPTDRPAEETLRGRCEAGFGRRGLSATDSARTRLDEELTVIGSLGYPAYFLTVADVVDLIKSLGVRCAARGSGAGSLVNYLLGISDVDPLRYGLLMERFLSPLRAALPDIDVDVESARRTEVYEAILTRYGGPTPR